MTTFSSNSVFRSEQKTRAMSTTSFIRARMQGEATSAFARVWPGLNILWRQYLSAQVSQEDLWDYAVSDVALRSLGLTRHDLMELIEAQYVDYATRSEPLPGHPPVACWPAQLIVLTPIGAAVLENVVAVQEERPLAHAPVATRRLAHKPRWDAHNRELRYMGRVVKRFHKILPDKEMILAALEQQSWPESISDPLPPCGDVLSPLRLYDLLGRLNRSLYNPVVRFACDGTGRRIFWRIA